MAMLSDDELEKLRGLVTHSKAVSERTGGRGPLFDWQHTEPLIDTIDALRARLAAAEARCKAAQPLVTFVMRREWFEMAANEKDEVWCRGCGVQLYSFSDDFTAEHRSECPVLQAQAWMANAADAAEGVSQ